MKLLKSIGSLMMAALLVSACSTPVYVQTDESAGLAKYKTYMWVRTQPNENDNKNVTAFADENVYKAVKAEMEKEGWTEVNTDPDVLISYDILVERNVVQQSDAVYTQPFSRVYYNPYWRRWGTVYYPSRFIGYDTYDVPVKEGTLTVTIMDADTDKAVWQAWTTEQMDNMKFTGSDIEKAVKKIFKKFDTGNK